MEAQYKRLGDILEAQGLITVDQLEAALEIQETEGRPLGKILTQQRLISEEALAKALAFQKNLSLVDLLDYDVDRRAAALVDEEIARRYTLIPINFDEGRLVVAVANPLDVHAIDSIQMITGLKITPVVATASGIDEAISRYLAGGPAQIQEAVDRAARMLAMDETPPPRLVVDDDVPMIKLANTILTRAVTERASDVHIECGESAVRVRYRIDGVLREAMRLPEHLKGPLVSRFKIMSAIDISERRRPQDGRMSLKIKGHDVEFRAATLPGVYGESFVLRLLTGGNTLIKLEALGMDEELLALYRIAFNRSHGGVLVTGPTGSGKTTTLYSMLNELNSPEKKIITIEDPIEYCLESVTQMQINRKAGLDFATGLRSIVRADPDILMVGEIRDLETARISVSAAFTGLLVLSSIHTNDAAGAITRLIDMGIDPYVVTSSIKCVLAQRLVRLLCPHCKQPVEYDRAQLKGLDISVDSDSRTFYDAKGCRKCQNTGHQGRTGIFELLIVDDEINKLAIKGESSNKIKKRAVAAGMRTLYRDGILKAEQGIVSINEVRRVVM